MQTKGVKYEYVDIDESYNNAAFLQYIVFRL